MADGHVIAENQRPLVAHHVQHGAVLNVGASADANVVHIAANHRTRPDAGVLANHHVADDDGGGVDIGRFRNLRPLAAVGSDVGLSSQSCLSLRSNLVTATSGWCYLIAGAQYIAPLQKNLRTSNHVKISSALPN